MGTLARNAKGYNYNYATLNQIKTKLRPLLKEHGLTLINPVKHIEGRDVLCTQIIELETGEQIESQLTLPEGVKAQDSGSAVTYFRRYNLLALLDLEVEDDDGSTASGKKSPVDAFRN